ncbi:MAG: DNA alkylation repair protein [Flavisolibacter sp.]|nr:DNA alkylation repair protein [Flavisolibacter sp.]
MTCQQVLSELQQLGEEKIKQIFINHGAKEPLYGVKVENLKKIQKKIKKNYELSLELYNTGISDAQYLAGLIADETKMTKKDLEYWADKATWYMLSEYTVPWIAAESSHGYPLALQWIDAKEEHLQVAGWSTLASLVAIKPDDALDIAELKKLIIRVKKEIHTAHNRTRYAMNSFLISVGCYVKELTDIAEQAGREIGKLTVNMGNTSCKVPFAPNYIQKVKNKDTIGKKRKMARC